MVGAEFDHPHFFILIILLETFPRPMGKLHWKGEPYRFSSYRDPLLNKDIILILYKDLFVIIKEIMFFKYRFNHTCNYVKIILPLSNFYMRIPATMRYDLIFVETIHFITATLKLFLHWSDLGKIKSF